MQEHTDSPEKAEVDARNNHMDQGHNRDDDDKDEQQDPPADNVDQNQSATSLKTAHRDEVHKTDAIIVRNCFLFYPLLILHAVTCTPIVMNSKFFFVTINTKSDCRN